VVNSTYQLIVYITAGRRKIMLHLSTILMQHITYINCNMVLSKLKIDYNHSTMLNITESSGWKLQWL